MNTRRLLSSSAIYGLADLAVVAVSGFLLLPLYTRALTQGEFGHYVAVRANIDILTYAIHLGIPTAVARLYFEQKKAGTEHRYMSSVVWMFFAVLGVLGLAAAAWGAPLWRLLSPSVPVLPALPYAFAISALGFLGSLSIIWLRSEGKAVAVLGLQLGTSAVMASVATGALLGLGMQMEGILLALLVGALVPAIALPVLFGRRFRWGAVREDVTKTLHYALPVLAGYIAYFVLNRFSTLLLQRHVSPEELGVFGLAQQLSMIVAMACTSFGAALQPMVFNSDAERVNESLLKAGRLLMSLMFLVTVGLMLFSRELVAIVAPRGYATGLGVLTVLAVGNFTLASTLVSETALLYHHRIKTSVGISIASAAVAAALGLWLVPTHHIVGGGLAVAGGLVTRMLLSQWAAWKLTGIFRFPLAVGGTVAAAVAGWFALQVQALPLEALPLLGIKVLILSALLTALFLIHRKL
jgi:O-antigen/teichoic acid export membrane protein